MIRISLFIYSTVNSVKHRCLSITSKQNCIMKRSLRKTTQIKQIIELSDSENDDNVIKDDDYVPEKKVSKVDQTRKRIRKDDPNVDRKKRKSSTLLLPSKEEQTDLREKIQSKRTKSKKTVTQAIDKENVKELKNFQFNSVQCKEWTELDYVCEKNGIDKHTAENVIKLFNDENTIPFIARYRKNITGGLEPDKLRALKESLDHAKLIKQRAATITKSIDKLGQWSPEVHAAIVSAKCLDDLEHIYSFFKPASKASLAEKARKLGLGPVSDSILQGHPLPQLSSLISDKDGLKTEEQIKDGIIHIIAETINKDKMVFDRVKELQSVSIISIQSTECKSSKSKNDKKEGDKKRKYEMYYNFDTNTKLIKPHHILAINRGEAQKILSVKLSLPNSFEEQFKAYCLKLYRQAMAASKLHTEILHNSIDYAYKKFIKPLVTRRVRNELKQKAETASIEVFASNVKQLLLIPPVRGKVILGIDPGFYHGCKLAVISEHGDVLDTNVIYPHGSSDMFEKSSDILIDLVKKHKCTILALGNATACRETESFLDKLIKSKAFGSLDVLYTIVDETGASIYSCNAEAKSEFPDLDTNVISAISIARRLQDPLAELVKIEPKHLGVGMYQHDLPEKQLLTTLNEVVSEAVSFVGVDVNTASQCLLKRVAGLNAVRTKNIIQWRTEFGAFKNRQQLLDVKGIGNKVFEQCAGFIRILPETSMTDNSVKIKDSKKSIHSFNLLDQTWIHPESYKIAERFLKYCNCNLENLGTTTFIEKIKSHADEGYAVLAEKCGTNATTMEIIVKGLSMKKDEDIRFKTAGPLFQKNMITIDDINTETVLTGAVRNVTHFGVFVDIGVGTCGLIPTTLLNNSTVSIGQRVEVKVVAKDPCRNRITLKLINVL
ncbi:S1 RNA-binding domain-containing protein 1 [Osmia lignaria lignaria]|uniref:S1 RNA-binding domain-containing protein 1 n=1 Tax=Osmia lignaria lignaria TaxID=1437193 RepID=UPI00402B37C1